MFTIGPDGKLIITKQVVTMDDYDEGYIRRVNKTCRSGGCIGINAVVPKIVKLIAKDDDTILDFGAGKKAIHAIQLKRDGLSVTAYEIGENYNPDIHDEHALSRVYSMIYCSNVVNVQPSVAHVEHIIKLVYDALADGGKFVVNYPESPRKSTMSTYDFETLLKLYFRINKCRTTTPAWVCVKVEPCRTVQ